MKKEFTHISKTGQPQMVDVSGKKITLRTARASGSVVLGRKIIDKMQGDELITKKGPVFQTAIIAGVMGAKKVAAIIPFCHDVGLEDCCVTISIKGERAIIESYAVVSGKTGVEMEALTAVAVAALTVYDMCKALSHHIVIGEIFLQEKTGGRKTFRRK